MADARPLSERIAANFRALIMAGELAPGAQLPAIPRYAEQHGVSTGAVQNAWQMLKDEGFVVSRPGSGVYVRDRETYVVDATAYYDPASRGVTFELLAVEELEPPADIAAALGEERAVLRYRRAVRDGEPMELSQSYYPASLTAGTPLARRGKVRGGAPAVLAELGYPEREFADRLSVRPPTTEEAERLDLPPGVPVIRQFRVVYSDNQRPVEVSVLIKPGHLYELMYRQKIES